MFCPGISVLPDGSVTPAGTRDPTMDAMCGVWGI